MAGSHISGYRGPGGVGSLAKIRFLLNLMASVPDFQALFTELKKLLRCRVTVTNLKDGKILHILVIFIFSIGDLGKTLIFGHIWPGGCILGVFLIMFGNF